VDTSGQEWTSWVQLDAPFGWSGGKSEAGHVAAEVGQIGHCIARPPAITPLGCLSIAPNLGPGLVRVATVVWQRESLGLPMILSPARREYTKDDSLPFATLDVAGRESSRRTDSVR